jgi:hypothetical protein
MKSERERERKGEKGRDRERKGEKGRERERKGEKGRESERKERKGEKERAQGVLLVDRVLLRRFPHRLLRRPHHDLLPSLLAQLFRLLL